MREILFRGKRTDNGTWTFGYLFRIWERAYLCWGTTNNVPNMKEVLPETVCQFTGLYDKNGRKIFEGDILKYEEEYYLVKFLEYRWAAIYKTCLPDDLDQRTAKDFEKVGNIYDNPELLEG